MTDGGGLALRGRSAGYGDTGPYSAFAQHVAQIAGFYDSDAADVAIDKLRVDGGRPRGRGGPR